MYQRDYLLKQFEQLGIVLAALLGFKAKGQYEKGLKIINEGYNDIPGFDPGLLSLDDEKEFLDHVINEEHFSYEKLNLIAGFLYEEGEFLFLSGNQSAAKKCYQKALVLFDHIEKNEKSFSLERDQKVTRIKEILSR